LLSLYLCLELRDYSNVIFYINEHLSIFISTLAYKNYKKTRKNFPKNCPILQKSKKCEESLKT
jgi:hypothetical protein